MNEVRRHIAHVYAICLVCGLVVAAFFLWHAWNHWVADGRPRGLDEFPRNTFEGAGIGGLALLNALAFAFVFARRGSNLLAPVAYLAVSAFQSWFALILAIGFHKTSALTQNMFVKGGYSGFDGWVPLSHIILQFSILFAITAAGLAWNWFASSWRGLEGRALYRWTQPLRSNKAAASS